MFRRAMAIAPQIPGTIASLAWADFLAGDYADAIAFSKQMLLAHQLPALARLTLANAYLQVGDVARARPFIRALLAHPGTSVQGTALSARMETVRGRPDRAARALHELDASANPLQTDTWDAAALAAAYVSIGDRPRAFRWLARVQLWERRQVAQDPRFAALRSDPRFADWVNG